MEGDSLLPDAAKFLGLPMGNITVEGKFLLYVFKTLRKRTSC